MDPGGPSLPKTLASRTGAASGGNETDLRLVLPSQMASTGGSCSRWRRAAVSAHHAGSPRCLWSLGGGASFPPTRPHLPSPPQTCPTGRTRQAFVQSGKTKASINSSDQVGRPRGSRDAQVIDFLNYPGVPLQSEASWKETWQFQTFKTGKINYYVYNESSCITFLRGKTIDHSWGGGGGGDDRSQLEAFLLLRLSSAQQAEVILQLSSIHPSSRNQDTLPGLAAASHEQARRAPPGGHLSSRRCVLQVCFLQSRRLCTSAFQSTPTNEIQKALNSILASARVVGNQHNLGWPETKRPTRLQRKTGLILLVRGQS